MNRPKSIWFAYWSILMNLHSPERIWGAGKHVLWRGIGTDFTPYSIKLACDGSNPKMIVRHFKTKYGPLGILVSSVGGAVGTTIFISMMPTGGVGHISMVILFLLFLAVSLHLILAFVVRSFSRIDIEILPEEIFVVRIFIFGKCCHQFVAKIADVDYALIACTEYRWVGGGCFKFNWEATAILIGDFCFFVSVLHSHDLENDTLLSVFKGMGKQMSSKSSLVLMPTSAI